MLVIIYEPQVKATCQSPSMVIVPTGVNYFVIYSIGMLMPLHIKTDIINCFYFSFISEPSHFIDVFFYLYA